MHIPLLVSFWFTLAAYVVHCIDESLLGGSFVEKVRQHWWPEYSWTKFFWFNAAYFVVMIASIILYDFRGGAWMILPLAWVIERACNGVWHVGWAIRFHEYSPGLVSSMEELEYGGLRGTSSNSCDQRDRIGTKFSPLS